MQKSQKKTEKIQNIQSSEILHQISENSKTESAKETIYEKARFALKAKIANKISSLRNSFRSEKTKEFNTRTADTDYERKAPTFDFGKILNFRSTLRKEPKAKAQLVGKNVFNEP